MRAQALWGWATERWARRERGGGGGGAPGNAPGGCAPRCRGLPRRRARPAAGLPPGLGWAWRLSLEEDVEVCLPAKHVGEGGRLLAAHLRKVAQRPRALHAHAHLLELALLDVHRVLKVPPAPHLGDQACGGQAGAASEAGTAGVSGVPGGLGMQPDAPGRRRRAAARKDERGGPACMAPAGVALVPPAPTHPACGARQHACCTPGRREAARRSDGRAMAGGCGAHPRS